MCSVHTTFIALWPLLRSYIESMHIRFTCKSKSRVVSGRTEQESEWEREMFVCRLNIVWLIIEILHIVIVEIYMHYKSTSNSWSWPNERVQRSLPTINKLLFNIIVECSELWFICRIRWVINRPITENNTLRLSKWFTISFIRPSKNDK